MPIPSEVSWSVPLILPFAVGLLMGLIVKRTISPVVPGIALIVVLSTAGYISPSAEDVYERTMSYLPRLVDTGSGFRDILPHLFGVSRRPCARPVERLRSDPSCLV